MFQIQDFLHVMKISMLYRFCVFDLNTVQILDYAGYRFGIFACYRFEFGILQALDFRVSFSKSFLFVETCQNWNPGKGYFSMIFSLLSLRQTLYLWVILCYRFYIYLHVVDFECGTFRIVWKQMLRIFYAFIPHFFAPQKTIKARKAISLQKQANDN